MELPFTHDEFLDVFASYNATYWWAALVLWFWTAGVAVRWLRRPSGTTSTVSLLLAGHWAWSGVVYHIGYFRSVNPSALVFGLLFILQSGLFLRHAYGRRRVDFGMASGTWRVLGAALIGYGLAYPALGLAFGLEYPRMPTFGVPCPTVILTIGFLLGTDVSRVKRLAVVPLIWAVVGGSAAFLLDVGADLVLGLAGVLMLVRIGTGRRKGTVT